MARAFVPKNDTVVSKGKGVGGEEDGLLLLELLRENPFACKLIVISSFLLIDHNPSSSSYVQA
jgi:hypothetical protein